MIEDLPKVHRPIYVVQIISIPDLVRFAAGKLPDKHRDVGTGLSERTERFTKRARISCSRPSASRPDAWRAAGELYGAGERHASR